MKLTTALRVAIANDILTGLAAGSAGDPVIEIYTGSMPSSMDGTITDTLLATLTCATTVGTQSNGVITFDPITSDSSADANGTAGWARVLDRDGNEVMYVTVADDGSGDINLNSVNIVAGTPVAVTSFVITVGGE